MDHTVVSNIDDHLDQRNISTSVQHGFRANRSCETQLIIATQDLATVLNRHRQVNLAVLDFSKAIDKVPHQRLLHKFGHYGISGPPFDCVLSLQTAFHTDKCQIMTVTLARKIHHQ